jgi:hypothetical protein
LSSFAWYRAVYGALVSDGSGGLTITVVQAFYLNTPDAPVRGADAVRGNLVVTRKEKTGDRKGNVSSVFLLFAFMFISPLPLR